MGRRSPDRWPAEQWRKVAPTVARMREGGWVVLSYCQRCRLTMLVDLELIIRDRGGAVVLWNRTATCRRLGCGGLVEFQAKPPELHAPFGGCRL